LCGIAGYTRIGRSFAGGRLRRALDDLVHRGPDELGTYETKSIALGVVRLSILDLVSGSQPMSSEDRDVVVVFNGEIYNYKELRDQLSASGHTFRTRSDTEVILHAFLEWDTACFSRFRGMFAMAIWTESKKRLVLARDRVGIKPLYVCRSGSDICFGSELKSILVHPEVDRVLDLEALNCYLSLNYVPAPYTLVKGIVKVPAGHWLEWREGQVSVNEFWRLEHGIDQRWTAGSAAERLDELLAQSVREHLVSDVPLGVWTSGGLDSSTILHYAAAASTARIKTFSVSFQGRSCDESKYFRQIARHYGTDHEDLDLSPELDLAQAIEQLPYYHDEPGADAGALPIWFLAKMSRRKVTVLLSGEGADELFGGYVTYLADRIVRPLHLIPASFRRFALRALRYWPVSDDKISLEYKVKRFLEGSLLPAGEAHAFWNGSFSEEQKRGIWAAASPGPLQDVLCRFEAQLGPVNGLNRYLFFDQCFSLPDGILAKVDRMSMAHSLEVRPPFLDHRVVEFAASLPYGLKIHGLNQKYLLRQMMKHRLPPFVLQRKKEGFDIPAHEWFRGPLRPLLLDTLTPDAVEQTGLFRWDGVQSLIDAHMQRRANLGYHLWGLLMLFLWIRRWNVEAQPLLHRATVGRARVAVASG
jgi:asparagine synthase (glutamine-hydrolysing)